MIDFDALRADRAAGTPGPWDAALERGCHGIIAAVLPHETNFVAIVGNSTDTPEREPMRFANARRIARLPDLEDAVLALHEENQRLQRAVLAAEARGLERAAQSIDPAGFDYPSVYMGGPSARARRMAGYLADAIRALITPEMRKVLEQEQGNG